MLITTFLFILTLFIANHYKAKRYLHMLQQNLYNENNRYVKWIIKNKNQFLDIDLLVIGISILGVSQVFNSTFFMNLCLLIISFSFILMGVKWRKVILTDQNKKKFVVTARIKRLTVTISLLYIIPLIFLGVYLNDPSKYWICILCLSIMTYLNSFIALLAVFINFPIEKCINYYYTMKAKKKLKNINGLKVIGITGSYGKTSSKNIVSTILNYKYNTFPTPKNLNTHNGIVMAINNQMDKFTNVFIAEMGAYTKGEIKELCKFVKPQYGILTTIGTAHLETFGSEQNIIDAKFELIESLPSNGFAILNGDDPKQVNYSLKNNVRVIWIGIDNQKADVVAKNIQCSNKGTSFDVVFKGDKERYHFQTKLLGNHNVYNILAGIACGKEFGIGVKDLIQAVKSVQPVEHRLELKRMGRFYMIDDAYNSNPVGAKKALEVLDLMPGLKVVVTPGMVELGKMEDEYNKTFGEQISDVADYVVLIGNKKTNPIREGLLGKKFDKDKIIVFNDVREAYSFIEELSINKEVYALFENDLPDTYNEK